MAGPSLPPRPLKLYTGTSAHLVAVVERDLPAACVACRGGFAADELVPSCERCGDRSTHFGCYVDAIAREPRERAFFATGTDLDAGAGGGDRGRHPAPRRRRKDHDAPPPEPERHGE